ncbi:MAG: hypothetical protein ACKOPN_01400, partial [Prochlorococcaceae cyanobacterium]
CFPHRRCAAAADVIASHRHVFGTLQPLLHAAVVGLEALGVYGASPDRLQSDLWSVKVWLERPNNVQVRSDAIRCGSTAPMRITTDGRQTYLRALNPGGAITPSNRVDHLIWWAVCHPAQAGRDPAGLGGVARQLGYSGQLVEREEVVVAGGR